MEILNFKKIEKGCLIAKFDVKIPKWGLTLRGCSIFEKDGKRWIGLPSIRLEAKNGSSQHYDHVIFDKTVRSRFDSACLEKIKDGLYTKHKENTENIFNGGA